MLVFTRKTLLLRLALLPAAFPTLSTDARIGPRDHRRVWTENVHEMSPESSTGAQTESSQGKSAHGQGKGKLRGLPKDTPEIRISKTITWLLRHAARQEGLRIREDGYAPVHELLKLPHLQNLDFPTLEKIVREDKKSRFKLIYEPDTENIDFQMPIWWIRTNQGHSMKSVMVEMDLIRAVSDIPSGIAVHGTSRAAWGKIKHEGLSRVTRNHIHFAQGIPGSGVISGMRNKSQVFIYIDVQKALDAGLKFYLSSNGVVLSEGDEKGFIRPQFFKRVVDAKGALFTDWQAPAEPSDTTQKIGTPSSQSNSGVALEKKVESLTL